MLESKVKVKTELDILAEGKEKANQLEISKIAS